MKNKFFAGPYTITFLLTGFKFRNVIELVVSTLVNNVLTNYRQFSDQTHYEIYTGIYTVYILRIHIK